MNDYNTDANVTIFTLQSGEPAFVFRKFISTQWLFVRDPYTDLYLPLIRDSD